MTFPWWLVAILTCIPLSTFPSEVSLTIAGVDYFFRYSECLEELAISVLFWTYSQTSKWVRSCAYFGELLVHMTTPQVALNCLINCLPSGN